MRLLEQDKYIDCKDLIKEAKGLYERVKDVEGLSKEERNYIEEMNKYINKNDLMKEHLIKGYIEDMLEMKGRK